MTILSKILDVVTGGTSGAAGSIAGGIVDMVTKYFPPDMTEEQRAQITLAAENFQLQKELQASQLIAVAEKEVDDRIAMYEGSASDLKSIPYLGAIMLFIRGSQRPMWGFAVMFIDYNVFSGSYKLSDPIISNAFWVLNFLVLGFLFGERAVMNVMPFITNMIATRNAAPQDVFIATTKK